MESDEELRPYLFAIAYRMLGSVADAEDVVQEVFLRYHADDVQADSPKADLAKTASGPPHLSIPAARADHSRLFPAIAGSPWWQ